ncbi:serine hydrolase domain-containing protein [Nocardia abscessus]|uniref:serine hydrolase domain-containing protein n=1 Tax=Nocardia abscessus TaxID=120957 RepID=UPI0024549D70|nr:serine hydrolase domain-containing protein [Nocardia abscessus]
MVRIDNDHTLRSVEARIRELAAAYCEAGNVPGSSLVSARRASGSSSHGTANVATGAPMLEDTGFLFGSVTKVLTTTLVLQQVERGLLDLDTPVRYLPEFALTVPGPPRTSRRWSCRPGASGPTTSLIHACRDACSRACALAERDECPAVADQGETPLLQRGAVGDRVPAGSRCAMKSAPRPRTNCSSSDLARPVTCQPRRGASAATYPPTAPAAPVTSSQLPSPGASPSRSRICAAASPLSGSVDAVTRSRPSGTTARSVAGTTSNSA